MKRTKVADFPLLLFGALFVMVSLLTFYFGAFGLAWSLVISSGAVSLWYSTEGLRLKFYEAKVERGKAKAEQERFSNELAAALEKVSYKTGADYEALRLQCETAAELSDRWEEILQNHADLRAEEAEIAVVFEESFIHYADRLSKLNFENGEVQGELETGGKMLLDFHKYLVCLAVKAEMG